MRNAMIGSGYVGLVSGACFADFGHGVDSDARTDDMREAPALAIVTALQDGGASVRGYDPEAMEQARQRLPDMTFADSAYACVEGADAPVLVDLRNVYPAANASAAGVRYVGVGRD